MFRHRYQARLRYLLHLSGWIYIALIVFWFGLRLVFFDRIWWLALLNTIALYLFVPLAVFLPLSIWLGQRRLVWGLVIPAAVFFVLLSWLIFPPISTPTSVSSQAFTVMSFNILWSNQNYAQIAKAVESANPNIIGLQEVRPPNITALKAALSNYPYSAFHPPDTYHTVGLVSQFPIVSATPLPNPPIERGLEVVVNVNGTPVTVIVAHRGIQAVRQSWGRSGLSQAQTRQL